MQNFSQNISQNIDSKFKSNQLLFEQQFQAQNKAIQELIGSIKSNSIGTQANSQPALFSRTTNLTQTVQTRPTALQIPTPIIPNSSTSSAQNNNPSNYSATFGQSGMSSTNLHQFNLAFANTNQFRMPSGNSNQYCTTIASTSQTSMPSASSNQFRMPSANINQLNSTFANTNQPSMPSASSIPVGNRANFAPVTTPADSLLARLVIQNSSEFSFQQFWRHNPQLWFELFEQRLDSHRIVRDDDRYFNLVKNLSPDIITEMHDVLGSLPSGNKCETLKKSLLSKFVIGNREKLNKFFSNVDIGHKKPSEFLQFLFANGGSILDREAILKIWSERLPAHISLHLTDEICSANEQKLKDRADEVLVAYITSTNLINSLNSENSNLNIESII